MILKANLVVRRSLDHIVWLRLPAADQAAVAD
jgi:hypothetical protein